MNARVIYRKAVATQSPGLLQPWDATRKRINRNAVASCTEVKFLVKPSSDLTNLHKDATRSGLICLLRYFPGLKQPWALGRNRFAVNLLASILKNESEHTLNHND